MVRLRGFQKLATIEEAEKLFFNSLRFRRHRTEVVPVWEALNRVLAENLIAEEDLPRFDRSAVDGYAVKAEDTFGASQFKPKDLKLTSSSEVKKDEAKQVWTGNPLPSGADAVLMLENVKLASDSRIEVWTAVTPGENVSKRGEDIAKGEVAVKAGTRLKPHHLALISALGKSEVRVFEKPKVAILATGNELVKAGEKPREDQIYETNRVMLASLCHELGAEPIDLGIAKDDVNEISERLRHGLTKADIVVTTGGTSVGASDLVPTAINRLGKPGVLVHGVAMRPAMPTALAIVDGKPVIVLSGNPVAAFFGFEVFARPLILKMLGIENETRPVVMARLARRTSTALGRKTFVRVRIFKRNGEFYAEPISARGSGIISTLTKANGYVVVPENREGLEEGEAVQVHLFDALEVFSENV
ncbi:MAG: molybdopterin molybdotransferase MoeA [Candidatus Bathyarchaeia archaeon]